MNKEQKAAVVEEVAGEIQASDAIFAVDYRGISVPQAAELRTQLTDAGARFRVVKNTLTERAADKAGAEALKAWLEGPTAFTYVSEGGDVALAAKALARFRREHQVLAFKGGTMGGDVLTIDQIEELARLPGREQLHGQLVGVVASPLTTLVRGLASMISGLASQLQQIADSGQLTADSEQPTEDDQPAEEPQPAEDDGEASEEAQPTADSGQPTDEPTADSEQPTEEAQPTEDSGEASEEAQPTADSEQPTDEPTADSEQPTDEQETSSEEA